MKKVLLSLCAAISVIGMSSCSEDFDVAAPYKDITVVYGLLNAGENSHYIRIQKAFLSQNTSAIEMAKIPDSSFYNSLEVSMREISASGSFTTLPLIMDTLGPKTPGTFFTTPNIAYRYDRDLRPGFSYRLVILNKRTGNVDSATTEIIDTVSSIGSNKLRVNELDGPAPSINFSTNNVASPYKLTIQASDNKAYYFEGYIKFKYWTDDAGVLKDSSFIWRFAQKTVDPSTVTLEVPSSSFLPIFKSNIAPATATQVRYIDSAEVYIWTADRNYKDYMLANQLQGGITADQIKPTFTTIQGKNTIGVFGSRALRRRINVPLSTASVELLDTSNVTIDLRFRGRKTP